MCYNNRVFFTAGACDIEWQFNPTTTIQQLEFFITQFLPLYFFRSTYFYPPVSEASRKVANLTERKIHIPLCMVSKNLSVSPCVTNFDPNYLRTG